LFLPLLLHLSLSFSKAAGFGAPTARAALENVSVMQQAIQHGGDSGAVTLQFAPVVDRSIRCEKRTGAFVSAHDDLQ
jgi:hypothetical protein